MLFAEQKLRENVAEYVLYMYQIEDVIRAYRFDLDRIMEEFVQPQLPDASFTSRYRAWYQSLIREMEFEKITETGHLMRIKEVLVELSYLHNTMLNISNDEKYKALFEAALPNIEDFKEHSNLKDKNALEVAFHALYMKMLLRMQRKEISSETEEAFDSMRILLAYLSKAYRDLKSGGGDYWNN